MMGFPDYKIMEGEIYFKGKNIGNLSIEERAKLGIAVVFQHPPIIKGIKLSKLLEKISKQVINMKEFPIKSDLLSREINEGKGVKSLDRALRNEDLVIIDEIGKMEIFSDKFKEKVLACLNSKKIVLATIGIGGNKFISKIKERKDIVLFTINIENRDRLIDRISSLILK